MTQEGVGDEVSGYVALVVSSPAMEDHGRASGIDTAWFLWTQMASFVR